MIHISDKKDCCGCTACYSICPKSAIQMVEDKEGFLYPNIDLDLCINCSLCEKVCPIHHRIYNDIEPESFVVRIRDFDILAKSASGGFMTPLAKWVLNQGGVLCGAVFDQNYKVVHQLFQGGRLPDEFKSSKYVQSDLGNCFKQIKTFLEKGMLVCFVGAPCQVAGLKSYLQKDYKNLISVDFVCHGTPSPKLWKYYIEYQKNRYNSEICSINFKNKTYGYHSGTMRIEFSNKKIYTGSARIDYMLKCFFYEIASRPSCYKCSFKTLQRCSDFTIYDCWHATQLTPDIRKDDDRGYTNLIVQSEKGHQILRIIKENYIIYSVHTDKAVALDGVMVYSSAIPHPKRDEFLIHMDNCNFPLYIKSFVPVTLKDHIIEYMKKYIYKAGIYMFLKNKLKK